MRPALKHITLPVFCFLMLFVSRLAHGEQIPFPNRRQEEPAEKAYDLKVGIWLGVGFTPPTDADKKAILGMTGIEADLRWKYFGVETEGFYGVELADPNPDSSEDSTAYGSWSDFYLNVPISSGDTQWLPRAGMGYAYLGENGYEEGSVETESVQGPYVLFGLEVEHQNQFFIDLDYSSSVASMGGSSSVSELGAFDSNGFYRLRGQVSYRIADHWALGVRLMQEGVQIQELERSLPGWQNRMECQGLLQWHL